MPHHLDFDALFHEDSEAVVSLPQGNRDELQATKRNLEHALVCHQPHNEITNVSLDKINYWDCLRRHYLLQPEKFSIILNLASRHSLTWTNTFIESMVQLDTGTQTFTVNAQRLETLIFLQKHCGLQSRDLSNAESPHTIHDDNVRLLERAIEGDNFNEHLLDEVSGFLKTLKHSDAINWAMFLVKQGFLNFSMLRKKCFIEESGQRRAINEGEFLRWLTQWATQCGVAENMMKEGAFEAEFIADSALSPSQRTLRNMVHYGLSPNWLAMVGQEGVTPQVNANFQSALEHHQKQDGTFDTQCARNEFVQAIVGQSVEDDTVEVEPNERDRHEWLQTYTAPKDQHALHRLREVLSLERLKFYHDYHRLPALIRQVQEGKLSLAEIAEYDKPLNYKKEFDEKCKDGWSQEFKDFCLDNSPRILPRLLAGFSEPATLSTSERIKQMAAYDMHDYRPKPNLIADDGKDEKIVTFFKVYDTYLQNYFNQVILPIAEERTRLYLKLIELQKKNAEQWQVSKSLVGNFDAQIHLVEQKIDIFSGFLEEACYKIKVAEMKAIIGKDRSIMDDCNTSVFPNYMMTYCKQMGLENYWKGTKLKLLLSKPISIKKTDIGIYLDENQKLKFSCNGKCVPGNNSRVCEYDLEELGEPLLGKLKTKLLANKEKQITSEKIFLKKERNLILKIVAKHIESPSESGLEQMRQNSLYRIERSGISCPSDTKNPHKTRTRCEEPVLNNPQHPLRACVGYISGLLFAIPKWIIQAPVSLVASVSSCISPASPLWLKAMCVNQAIDREYAGVFYATRSHYTLFKEKDKTKDVSDKFIKDIREKGITFSDYH